MSIIVKNKKAGKINKYGVAFFDMDVKRAQRGLIQRLQGKLEVSTIKEKSNQQN